MVEGFSILWVWKTGKCPDTAKGYVKIRYQLDLAKLTPPAYKDYYGPGQDYANWTLIAYSKVMASFLNACTPIGETQMTVFDFINTNGTVIEKTVAEYDPVTFNPTRLDFVLRASAQGDPPGDQPIVSGQPTISTSAPPNGGNGIPPIISPAVYIPLLAFGVGAGLTIMSTKTKGRGGLLGKFPKIKL